MYVNGKIAHSSREWSVCPHFFKKTSRAEESGRKIKKSDSDAEVQRKSRSLNFLHTKVMARNRHPSRLELLFRRLYGTSRAAFMAKLGPDPAESLRKLGPGPWSRARHISLCALYTKVTRTKPGKGTTLQGFVLAPPRVIKGRVLLKFGF